MTEASPTPWPEPRKAEEVPLHPGATTAEAFTAVVAECTDHWQTNEAVLLKHRNMTALHQTRVGLRRLRSTFSLFRPWFGTAPSYAALGARLRAHTLPLGPARDLDVLLAGPHVADLTDAQRDRLREAREAAYDVVIRDLRGEDWARVKADLADFVADCPWGLPDPPALETASAALERRWRRVMGRGWRLRELSAAERHEVRIQAKKLRYGAQFFADLYPGREDAANAYADTVGGLQDALGLANDAAVAADLLASVGAASTPIDHDAFVEGAEAAWREVAALRAFWR